MFLVKYIIYWFWFMGTLLSLFVFPAVGILSLLIGFCLFMYWVLDGFAKGNNLQHQRALEASKGNAELYLRIMAGQIK